MGTWSLVTHSDSSSAQKRVCLPWVEGPQLIDWDGRLLFSCLLSNLMWYWEFLHKRRPLSRHIVLTTLRSWSPLGWQSQAALPHREVGPPVPWEASLPALPLPSPHAGPHSPLSHRQLLKASSSPSFKIFFLLEEREVTAGGRAPSSATNGRYQPSTLESSDR